MENSLDNPVWNALISGNKHLSAGSERVKFFDREVSPFAGLIKNTPANLLALYELSISDHPVLLWSVEQLSFPKIWKVIDCIPGYQMLYDLPTLPQHPISGITQLTEKDVPEMMALTKLTKPGPFGKRTIEFGHYEGIFENRQLVAMTGQRFHPFDHVEISAVCTHPDYLGKGYAKQLLCSQLAKIVDTDCKPHLHVRQDNERAIHVYKTLGFRIRIPVYFYVIQKMVSAGTKVMDQ